MDDKKKLKAYFGTFLFFFVVLLILLISFGFLKVQETRSMSTMENTQSRIHNLQSFLVSLAVMDRMGSLPHTIGNLSIFRGFQTQALSVLSEYRKTVPQDLRVFGTINALESLLVYEGIQQSHLFKRKAREAPLLPPAIAGRLMGLSIDLLRYEETRLAQETGFLRSFSLLRVNLLEAVAGIIFLLGLFFIFFQRQSARVVQVLGFELSLIKQMMITSHVIEDWKQQVREILQNISRILPIEFLYSSFSVKGQIIETNFFWNRVPDGAEQNRVESMVRKTMEEKGGYLTSRSLEFTHDPISIGESQSRASALKTGDLATKTLFLDAPKIGGIVGVGLRPLSPRDKVQSLVIESLLTTILTVIGSVKAVHLYTKEMEYYAVRDSLTSLFNQRTFWEFLEYEIARSNRHNNVFSILVLDLDDFKQINDEFGHIFGDHILQHLADVLRKGCRKEDILCRYGGDEFAVILPNADTMQALSVARWFEQEIGRNPLETPSGLIIRPSISAGIATWPLHGREARDLFYVADHMMYQSKRDGKNRITIPTDDDVHEVFRIQSRHRSQILQAIREERVQPYFQPIRHLETGKVFAYEVLARLEIGRKLLSAAEFIEVVEDSGLIAHLDYTVMEKAFSEKMRVGFPGPLFVNLSPKALFIPEFISKIHDIVKKTQVPASEIVFEITERDTVRNLRLVEKFLQNLRGEGLRFAVDDFGAGYASLSYLGLFPVDFLKIDGAFMIGAGEKVPVDLAIIQSIVSLGERLEITVIGEAIENECILRAALENKIPLGQGYHLGYPSPDFSS